jgi:outer membrane protein OmpA-like peptidoglycan-associated protein
MIRLVASALVAASACACQLWTRPAPPRQDVIVLLPDPETRAVGRAVVSSPLGAAAELTTERAATSIGRGRPPTAPFTLSEAQVHLLFDDAMAARPPAPRHFLLYFFTDSTQLKPESDILLSEVLRFVKSRPAPDVTVIGHTDTFYTARTNFVLGLNRAKAIRNRLVGIGLDRRFVSVASHGEADLLVRTPDDTREPRNRRVEVSVR